MILANTAWLGMVIARQAACWLYNASRSLCNVMTKLAPLCLFRRSGGKTKVARTTCLQLELALIKVSPKSLQKACSVHLWVNTAADRTNQKHSMPYTQSYCCIQEDCPLFSYAAAVVGSASKIEVITDSLRDSSSTLLLATLPLDNIFSSRDCSLAR